MTILVPIFLLALLGGYWFWSKRQARAKLFQTALTEDQRKIVANEVPLTRRLPLELREAFEGKINAFLEQVEFFGCNGLEVTDRMRLSIAAQACLLIANTDNWYDNLGTILIYPGAFKSMRQQRQGYVVAERETIRLGESWARGPVVLSWAHAEAGAHDEHDGRNVVFHEFAHQLDSLSGSVNGVPVLQKGQDFADWEKVFVEAFDAHLTDLQHGRATVIDPYGAENYEEFFAVSVELFFERPAALARAAPHVFEQLSLLMRLDPKNWAG